MVYSLRYFLCMNLYQSIHNKKKDVPGSESEIIFNNQSDDPGTKQYAQKIVC